MVKFLLGIGVVYFSFMALGAYVTLMWLNLVALLYLMTRKV